VTRAVVVAPHPDDEVLGASGVLRDAEVTVVHVSDGVPPWAAPGEGPGLLRRRRAECAAAWELLGAEVADVVRLGLEDLGVWRAVPELAQLLAHVLGALAPTSVHVPAYQGGHPDHDATFAAALLARRATGDRHRWFVYGLYGYDASGTLCFGALDPGAYPGATRLAQAPPDLERKATALGCFASQLRPGSIVQRWLDAPGAEGCARLPPGLPADPGTCFYDHELDFARFGVTSAVVRTELEHGLGGRGPVG
jgi:LmbE family N-acetylglucosaminyl deacetylase